MSRGRKRRASQLRKDCGHAGNDVTRWLSYSDTTQPSLFQNVIFKRKGLERKSKDTPHPCLQTKCKEGTLHREQIVSNRCPLEAALLNHNSSSQSESSRVWLLSDRMSKCTLKNFPAAKPIQRAYYHRNAEHLRIPAGNLWNHTLKSPARKPSASHTVTFEV